MKKYRVDVSEPAENDLRDIVRYISAQLAAPLTAVQMITSMENAFTGLMDTPHKYPLVADERLASMGYRKLVVKNYIVFFIINEKDRTVGVERILYARRDWLGIV